MRNFAILASVMMLAAGSSNCSSPAGAANDIVPSGLVAGSAQGDTTFGTNAAGGQGKGKGNTPVSGSGGSTLDYVIVTDNNVNGLPDQGDTIDFVVSTTEQWNQVSLACSQNGTVVLSGVRTSSAWYPIMLGSAAWQSGTIDCVATLDQYSGTKTVTLASKSFQAFAE